MTEYLPIYEPLVSGDATLADHRTIAFNGPDQEMFLHLGQFTAWYASAEFMLTMLVHRFSGKIHPLHFHALTKGMDGRVKAERLKKLIEVSGWTISPELLARLIHFEKVIVPIRNILMHNHPYWPAGADLQLSSLGAPPIFNGEPFYAPSSPPQMFKGLELFERSLWLALFAQDMGDVINQLPWPVGAQGILGTGPLRSPLPKVRHPKTGPKASPAKRHTLLQKQKRGPQEPPL